MLRFVFTLALASGLVPGAPVVTGGGHAVVETSVLPGGNAHGQTLDSRELLQNPGFESGSIDPWVTDSWVVTSTYPHSGTYCACDVGDFPITQWIDTTPGSEIQSVTFWVRQPEAPVAQAYCFLYSDGTDATFIHVPSSGWQQFDVTSKVDTSKSLVGFRLWGYTGGGPASDSTYIDDVSIIGPGGVRDVAVSEITCPRDTILLDSTYTPACRVANLGTEVERVQAVMTIEYVGGSPYYTDTTEGNVSPGDTAEMTFGPFQPDSAVPHLATAWTALASDTNRLNDTLRQFFWVGELVAVAEQPVAAAEHIAATVVASASLRSALSDHQSSVRDASGRLVVEPRPGVYFVRTAGRVRKLVVSR